MTHFFLGGSSGMIKRYLTRLLAKNKEFFINEGLAAKGFMQLLFKHRNTGEKWTREEKKLIKQHLKTMAFAIPALIVFLPPGGSIFLPILVDIMDRRKTSRRQNKEDMARKIAAENSSPQSQTIAAPEPPKVSPDLSPR